MMLVGFNVLNIASLSQIFWVQFWYLKVGVKLMIKQRWGIVDDQEMSRAGSKDPLDHHLHPPHIKITLNNNFFVKNKPNKIEKLVSHS